MVKQSRPDPNDKPTDSEGGAGFFDSALADQVKASAQQIWLAGMGAFARAQAEGGKMFESLVKDGGALQKKTQSAAEEKFSEMAGKMSSVADEIQAKAGAQWGKLENLFDDRTAKALRKLGFPDADTLAELSARVDALSAEVAALTAVSPKSPAPARKAAREMKRIDEMGALAPAAPATREMKRIDEMGAVAPAGLVTGKKAVAKKTPAKKVVTKPAVRKTAATTTPAKKVATRKA